jgi:hypothetical protein
MRQSQIRRRVRLFSLRVARIIAFERQRFLLTGKEGKMSFIWIIKRLLPDAARDKKTPLFAKMNY